MDGHLTDSQGRLVPIENVKPEHQLENRLVNDLITLARHHSNKLHDFKVEAFMEVNAFMELLADKYGVARGGKKGNLTLMSFDGLRRITVQNADYIQFGPELKIAKDLVDTCIQNWSEGVNKNLRMIIDGAFAVDKEGKINTQKVLELRRLNIDDAEWKKAMEAISNSVRVVSSKAYIRFHVRKDCNSDWEAISLDIARI